MAALVRGSIRSLANMASSGLLVCADGIKFRFDFRTSLQDWDKTNAEILKS
jgi:hypothetical protein